MKLFLGVYMGSFVFGYWMGYFSFSSDRLFFFVFVLYYMCIWVCIILIISGFWFVLLKFEIMNNY